MDVRYFLGERLAFIEQLYVNSAAPFIERKRKIEAEEEPFVPPYSEDPEPAFLSEWLEAEESLQVIGHTCISMLSASFHLYFSFSTRKKSMGSSISIASIGSTGSERVVSMMNVWRCLYTCQRQIVTAVDNL